MLLSLAFWTRTAWFVVSDMEISQLKEEIEKYRADYEENTKRLNEISTNPDAIEQIAREKYLMKKPNEDIYVFED